MKLLFAFLVLALTLTACSTYSDSDKTSFDDKIEAFLKKKGWKMERTSSGLYIETIQKGTGEEKAKFTSEILVAYKGTLLSGKVVDMTEPGKPLLSRLDALIGGFQESLLDKTAGTKLRLVIPPSLGYGDEDLEKIPPHSILVFEIELVRVN